MPQRMNGERRDVEVYVVKKAGSRSTQRKPSFFKWFSSFTDTFLRFFFIFILVKSLFLKIVIPGQAFWGLWRRQEVRRLHPSPCAQDGDLLSTCLWREELFKPHKGYEKPCLRRFFKGL